MKKSQNVNALLIWALVFLFASCRIEDIRTIGNNADADKQSVNGWTYQMMQDAYFWYDQMPSKNDTDLSQQPSAYFEKLVYRRQTHDRFSMITDDIDALQKQFNGVSKVFGIHYMIAFTDAGKSNVGAFLSHVSKTSAAEKAGLKRGDVITKVNGTALTESNYANLLGGSETIKVHLGVVKGGNVETDDSKTVSITKAEITENPIAFSKVISKGTRKIGYLVYTQFVPGTDADKNRYDNELRNIFGEFKSAGINELVLDLRLNGGGYMSSAVTLGSLIVSNSAGSGIFYKEQWNNKYIKYWEEKNGPQALTYKFTNEKNNVGAQLSRIFVLTSKGTASASELIINGLRPYMNVITIGDHTAGKNLFGTLIGDEKKRWKHGLYMMLGQTVNARGESDYGTSQGILPTKAVADDRLPYKAFGAEDETLLNAALQEMGLQIAKDTRTGSFQNTTELVSGKPVRDTPAVWDQKMIKDVELQPNRLYFDEQNKP
jgi:carboxyl-terminal processing protease